MFSIERREEKDRDGRRVVLFGRIKGKKCRDCKNFYSCLKDEEVEPADFGIKEDGNREIRANCLLMCGGEIK